jgi:hypothetical protein
VLLSGRACCDASLRFAVGAGEWLRYFRSLRPGVAVPLVTVILWFRSIIGGTASCPPTWSSAA